MSCRHSVASCHLLLPVYRQEELEQDQVAGKAKGEKAEEPVKPVMDVSIGGSAEAKKVRRLEREMRCV